MAYADEVLADSPLAYWRLDETSGTAAADLSGNGRTGTYEGAYTLGVPGLISSGTAFLTSSPGGYVRRASDTWIPRNALTAEVWAERNGAAFATNAGGYLIGRDSVADGFVGRSWYLAWLDDGRIHWRGFSGNSQRFGILVTAPSSGRHHIVGTYDGTTARLYIDGVQVGSVAASGGTTTLNGVHDLMVGRAASSLTGGFGAFNGVLDEAAVYGAALSATRIAAHYAAGGSTPPPSTATSILASAESDASVRGTATDPVALAASITGSGESSAWVDPLPPGFRQATTITGSGESHGEVAFPVEVAAADTSNRVGGRRRLASGTATWEPAVVPTPSNLVRAQAFDVAQAFSTVTMNGTRPVYDVTEKREARPRPRIVIGGTDVTYFRGVPTPEPSYQLVEPLLYGPATISLPQVAPCFERLGVGALKWARKGAKVVIQRVNDAGAVVATDYKGIVVAFNASGSTLTLEVGGEATGRAALRNRQVPLWSRQQDLGRAAYNAIDTLRLPFKPRLGPDTGILVRLFGGMGHLDYIQQLCALGWTRDGAQWTIMPGADGAYRMTRKDTTTIHGTVYLDDARVVGDLRRDIAEEPNRIYMTGVTPEGMRVKNATYPGLKQGPAAPYPMADGSSFGPGTTDAETSTGDGVTVMINRLDVTNYLAREDKFDGYGTKVTRAIKALQDTAGLPETGVMNQATWDALWDLSVTGYSLGWSAIQPMAQDRRLPRFRYSATGAIIGRNPSHDPSVLPVDVNIDVGQGFTRAQMREFARAELRPENNWVGTITINTGAVIAGEHVPGTPIGALLPDRDIRPGMNLWAPLFDGGTLLHVSAVDVDSSGVRLVVDTQARDAMKVWQVIQRNRESRSNPARLWMQEHRASTMRKDSITEFDEVGGTIERVQLAGDDWTVFPVVAGGAGTIAHIRLETNPDAEYVMAVFGREISERKLRHLIGNPLTRAGSRRWEKETVRDALDAQHVLLYAAGSDEEPLGYYPKVKTGKDDDDTSPAPLTGRWEDDAGFGYHTLREPVLWVAIYADRDTAIPAGQIMWPQLEAGA